MSQPFEMSIEVAQRVTEKNGFHLGTDERVARHLCEERYHGRRAANLPVVTVALMRAGKVVDVFDGSWSG